MALANSQMNRLVDQQDSPLLRLIFGEVPAHDAFVAQLACEPLHAIIKERFMNRGGVKTSAAGVVSSVARFEFVRGWPTEEQPAWLVAWNWQTSYMIAGCGGLDVLRHVREQGCEWDEYTCSSAAAGGHLEVLQWARANGCQWNGLICLHVAQARGHLMTAAWIEASVNRGP